MQRAAIAGLALVLVAFAGCTGSFNVKQTEPIRVQLEGSGTGSASTVSVPSGGEQDVDVDTGGAQHVAFDVDVKPTTTPTTIVVKVVDKDDGSVLGQQQITAPTTTQGPQTQVINVDVHGSHNVVLVTTAQGGDAVLEVTAHGTGNVQTGGSGGASDTGSGSLTGTLTDSATLNATASASGSGY